MKPFERWLCEELVPRVLEAFALKADAPRDRRLAAANLRQLSARMTLCKLRDHGAVADLAHSGVPLSKAQFRAVDRLGRDPAPFARPPGDALLAAGRRGARFAVAALHRSAACRLAARFGASDRHPSSAACAV